MLIKYISSINHLHHWPDHIIYFLKDQVISEGNFGVFKSPKNEPFFVRISALASKMGQI